jgi:hypothetical protein
MNANANAPRHSGLGIASFITSIVSGICIFAAIALAGVMEASTPGGIDEESAGAIMLGLALFAFMGLSLVALGLGIGGLFQKERKKVFAILGMVFAAATLLGTVSIIALGLAMG